MKPKLLSFTDLSKRHPGVSEGVSLNYSEAARVCLDRHHASPREFSVTDNERNERASAEWIAADERIKNAWGCAGDRECRSCP
jgi:hypothetical protein